MISIRRRISAWMLPGLAIAWAVGGITVYQTYRSAILSSIDSENMAYTRWVRANQRSQGRGGGPGWGRPNQERPITPDLPEDGLFYQVWDLDGNILTKSNNLAEAELPLLKNEDESIDRRTLILPSKIQLRTTSMTFGAGHYQDSGQGFGPPAHAGGGGGMPMTIVVARDLSEANSRLQAALFGIAGAGLLLLGGMILVLRVALRNGLRPLDDLTVAVSAVDPSSLHARFSTGKEPRELKPIVSRLDSLMDRVERGFLRERRFGADLAHELRTPISEMRTKLDLATKWPEERSDEFFRAAREINVRMERVVNTMLQLANLEGRSGNFAMEKIALVPLISEAWTPFAKQAENRQLKIDIRCSESATVDGSPDLWKHILSNLFSNSVEYTPAGGSILLERYEDGISISNTVGEHDIENAEQVFERFWRADGSRSDSHHSGLGLSLVQACAHNMGFGASASLERHGNGHQLVISVRRQQESRR